MKQKRTKPPPIRSKKDRWPPETKEDWTRYFNEMESVECSDWRHDCYMKKWKESEDYKARQKLAKEFTKRK